MRRRIYIDPESDLSDQTQDGFLFHEEGPPEGGRPGICDIGVLYDDELWTRYEAACAVVSDLRREICQKLVYEPFDEVELQVAGEWDKLYGSGTDDNYTESSDRLRARLLENAKSKVKP